MTISQAAIIAKCRNVPIFHMEAGNRCFDQRVPEEINRKGVGRVCTDNSVTALQRLTLELADNQADQEPAAARCRALFSKLFSLAAAVRQIVAALM